jgi:WD40 repeat protein
MVEEIINIMSKLPWEAFMRITHTVLITTTLLFLLLSPTLAATPNWIYSTGKGNPILDIDVSSDNRYIAAADGSLYYITSTAEVLTKGLPALTVDITSSSTGFATASDINVCLFNQRGEREWCYDEFPGDPPAVLIRDNDSAIITASSKNGRVYYFTTSGELSWTKVIGTPFYSIGSPADGSYVAGTAYYEQFFGMDHLGTMVFRREPGKGTNIALEPIVVSADGRYVLGSIDYGTTGDLMLFDRHGILLWENKTEGIKGKIAISDDGFNIADGVEIISKGPAKGLLKFYQLNRTTKQAVLAWTQSLNSTIGSVAMTYNGSAVAVGSRDGMIRMFDTHGVALLQYQADMGITSISLSSDGTALAAGTQNGQILFFSEPNGFPPETLNGTSETITTTPSIPAPTTPVIITPVQPNSDLVKSSGSAVLFISMLIILTCLVWVVIFLANKKKDL